MIPVGEHYQPSGRLEISGTLMATIGGAIVAAVCTGVVWAWESSPIPTLVILTPIIQGIGVGGAFYFLFGLAKLRNPTIGLLISGTFGVLSVLGVHYGHYVRFPGVWLEAVKKNVVDKGLNSPEQRAALAAFEADPRAAFEEYELKPNGYGPGFPSFMAYRAEHLGTTIKKMEVTGIWQWGLWIVEGGIVVIAAGVMGRKQTVKPFCEDCSNWCSPRVAGGAVWTSMGDELTQAVRAGDPVRIGVVAGKSAAAGPEPETVFAGLHICSSCRQTFADIVKLSPGDNNNTVETELVSQLRISPEAAGALQTPELFAAKPAQAPAEAGADAAAAEKPEGGEPGGGTK